MLFARNGVVFRLDFFSCVDGTDALVASEGCSSSAVASSREVAATPSCAARTGGRDSLKDVLEPPLFFILHAHFLLQEQSATLQSHSM